MPAGAVAVTDAPGSAAAGGRSRSAARPGDSAAAPLAETTGSAHKYCTFGLSPPLDVLDGGGEEDRIPYRLTGEGRRWINAGDPAAVEGTEQPAGPPVLEATELPGSATAG